MCSERPVGSHNCICPGLTVGDKVVAGGRAYVWVKNLLYQNDVGRYFNAKWIVDVEHIDHAFHDELSTEIKKLRREQRNTRIALAKQRVSDIAASVERPVGCAKRAKLTPTGEAGVARVTALDKPAKGATRAKPAIAIGGCHHKKRTKDEASSGAELDDAPRLDKFMARAVHLAKSSSAAWTEFVAEQNPPQRDVGGPAPRSKVGAKRGKLTPKPTDEEVDTQAESDRYERMFEGYLAADSSIAKRSTPTTAADKMPKQAGSQAIVKKADKPRIGEKASTPKRAPVHPAAAEAKRLAKLAKRKARAKADSITIGGVKPLEHVKAGAAGLRRYAVRVIDLGSRTKPLGKHHMSKSLPPGTNTTTFTKQLRAAARFNNATHHDQLQTTAGHAALEKALARIGATAPTSSDLDRGEGLDAARALLEAVVGRITRAVINAAVDRAEPLKGPLTFELTCPAATDFPRKTIRVCKLLISEICKESDE